MYFLEISLLVSFGVGAQQDYCASANTKAKIVDEHNKLRSMLALGSVRGSDGQFFSSGSNIYKLKWDYQLEALANQDVAHCKLLSHRGPELGVNSGASYAPHLEPHIHIISFISDEKNRALRAKWRDRRIGLHAVALIKEWWEAGEQLDLWTSNYTFNVAMLGEEVPRFTQMAWGLTTSVGCGMAAPCNEANVRETVFIICYYWPSGNHIGSKIYQAGPPCKFDSDCTTYPNSTCSVKEGLCVSP
uniref:Ancylostoma secreted protein n=1 Tax=Ascaris suum TaxID=6253 RepID=F1L974_ASCSU